MSLSAQETDNSGITGGSTDQTRLPMGIPGLDTMLHGGLPDGNAVLVQGAPGTGKTVLGMQFLHQGAAYADAPGLFLTFEEHPRRLYRDARALGWDFDRLEAERRFLMVFTSPSVLLKELESGHYGRIIHDYGIRRIVVDSLSHFEMLSSGDDGTRVRFERVVNALRRDGVTLLLTREVDSRGPQMRVTPEEYIADTIIQVEYELVGERRHRLIEVIKHRGSSHSMSQHRFVIAPGGLQILAPSDGGV